MLSAAAVQVCSTLLRNYDSRCRSVCMLVCGVTLCAETRLHLLSLFCVEFNWKSRESNEGNPVRWIA